MVPGYMHALLLATASVTELPDVNGRAAQSEPGESAVSSPAWCVLSRV